MKQLILFLKIILFFLGIIVSGQNLQGRLMTVHQQKISYAEIVLTLNEKKFSTISNDNGDFLIKLPYNGDYILSVNKDGELVYKENISIQNDVTKDIIIDLKEIQIQDVNISIKKKLIDRKIDRLVFNVENSVSATGGDAFEALSIAPGVRVINDQINIIGKNKVSIMVDDRLIQLSETDLINYLKGIRSEDIKSIEVITNPPSKYEAEGNSGIINIKLKKAKQDYISGNIKSSYTQAKYSLGNYGFGLNYQKKKTTFTSSLDYENGSTAPYQEYTLFYPNYTWFETNYSRRFSNNLSGRASLDYDISDKTTIGIQYFGSANKPVREGISTSFIRNPSNVLDSLVQTPSYLQISKKNHSLNFHTITKIDTLGGKVSFDLDYFKYDSEADNNFTSSTFLPNINNPNQYLAANNISDQNIDIYSSKIDVEMPLRWVNLSFGTKVSFINNSSNVLYYDKSTDVPILDVNKTNTFDYKENTQALYLSGNKKLTDKWEIQLGLRVENTQTKGYSQTLDQTNKNDYAKLFPTLYLNYLMNENSVFGFTYNRRIDRPTYGNLNPFRFYTTKYNYGEGNPFLQPYFTDNVELSYSYKSNYLSLYTSYITNGFDEVTYVSNDNPVQAVIPTNFFKQINIGLLESYVFNKWSWWESNNQANLFYTKTLSNIQNLNDISSWSLSISSTNSFVLNSMKTLKAEIGVTYNSPSIANSYKVSSFYFINAGIKLSLLEKKLQIALNAMDIFKTYKMTFTQIVNGIVQENYDFRDTQKIRLSLTWNFGKALKLQSRKLSNEEEKKRAQ